MITVIKDISSWSRIVGRRSVPIQNASPVIGFKVVITDVQFDIKTTFSPQSVGQLCISDGSQNKQPLFL
jgi:hypothetical protein